MYKKAIRAKMRVATSKGEVSVERLFDLSMTELGEILIGLDRTLKESTTGLDFIDTVSADSETQAKFELVKDVYLTKKREAEESVVARDTKAHNEAIMALIAKKREAALENLSIEELEAQLK